MEHLLDDRELEEFSDQINWIPWLDFDHDRTQFYHPVFIDEYPILRGWSRHRLDSVQRETSNGDRDSRYAPILAGLWIAGVNPSDTNQFIIFHQGYRQWPNH